MSLSSASFPGCSPPELVQCITGALTQPTGCHTPGHTLSPPRSHSIHTVPTFQRREQASGKLCSSLPRLQGRDTAIRMPLHLRSAGRTAVWGRRQGGQWRQRGQALGRSRWGTGEGPTVWRNGSEPQLQVHELFAALQGPHPVYRGRRGSTCAGQTLHLPIFQERLEIQILHEIFESLKVLINLFPVGDYCVVCGNQAGPTPQPRGQLSERLDNQT